MKRRRRAREKEEYLSVPDFQTDALNSISASDPNVDKISQRQVDDAVHRRIDRLTGLFRGGAIATRGGRMTADKLTSEQLIELVVGDYSGFYNSDSIDEMNDESIQSSIVELKSIYQQRRQEQRDLAKLYLERSARDNNRFPWLLADDPNLPTANSDEVHIDMHGRLVRRQNEENDAVTDVEFVDASETFWRQYSQTTRSKEQPTPTQRNNVQSMQQIEMHRQNRAPLHQHQNQQHITEQMERDAREAIQRALDRYRRNADANLQQGSVYELIPIPLVRQQEANEAGWFFHRQPNHENNQDRNRPHVGLAFRRICLAILTIAAAFLCTIFQDASLYLEDGLDASMESVWFSGLLGPHFEGHHSPFRQRNLDDISEEELTSMELLLNQFFDEDEGEEEAPDCGLEECDVLEN